jgi:hypothetical protein
MKPLPLSSIGLGRWGFGVLLIKSISYATLLLGRMTVLLGQAWGGSRKSYLTVCPKPAPRLPASAPTAVACNALTSCKKAPKPCRPKPIGERAMGTIADTFAKHGSPPTPPSSEKEFEEWVIARARLSSKLYGETAFEDITDVRRSRTGSRTGRARPTGSSAK